MREVFAEFVGVRSRLAALEEPLEAAARQGTSQTAKVGPLRTPLPPSSFHPLGRPGAYWTEKIDRLELLPSPPSSEVLRTQPPSPSAHHPPPGPYSSRVSPDGIGGQVSVSGRVTYAAALLGGLFEDVEEEAEVGGAGTGSGNLVSPGELQPPITPDRSSLATTLSLRSPAPLGRGSAVPPNLQEAAELLFGEGYQPGAVLNLQMEASPSGSARDKLVARFVAGGVRAAPACLRSLVYKARLGEGIGLMVAPMGSCVRDACPQLHPNSGVGLTRLMRDGSPLMQVGSRRASSTLPADSLAFFSCSIPPLAPPSIPMQNLCI